MKSPLPSSKAGDHGSGELPMPESKAQPPAREPRGSIFDTSYAPEGKELRKAWSRLNRRKPRSRS